MIAVNLLQTTDAAPDPDPASNIIALPSAIGYDQSAMSRASERDLEAGAKRINEVRAVRGLLAQGYTQRGIAVALRMSLCQVNRYVNEFKHLADDQLTAENLATKTRQCGRKTNYDLIAASPEIQQQLKQIYLSTCSSSSDYQSKDRRTGSVALALEIFADDPLCPAHLAQRLRAGAQPKCLVNIIREITPAVEQRFRGQRHAELNANQTQRRTMTEKLADGTIRNIERYDYLTFDDESSNSPFWFELPPPAPSAIGSSAIGDSPRWCLGRQCLHAFDITGYWVAAENIGTPRDAYTAAILLRFFERVFDIFLPRRGIILEQSVWAANSIRGDIVTASGRVMRDDWDRPAMAAAERQQLDHGLKKLGLEVIYTHTPRGKEIEGGFNYKQRVFQAMTRKAGLNMGRHAGEFEQTAKAIRQARNNGKEFHPAKLGFMHIDQHAEWNVKCMEWINARKLRKAGRAGTPLPADPPPRRDFTDRERALFLSHRFNVMIRNGQVTCRAGGVENDFTNSEVFARFGNGYRVTGYCDPSDPSRGAAIYNAETSSANFAGYQLGEFICMADFKPTCHRFDYSTGRGQDQAAVQRKAYNKHVRTSFKAVGLPRRSAATIRDGQGNVASTSTIDSSAIGDALPALPALPQRRSAIETSAIGYASSARRGLLARQAALAREALEEV